MAPHRNEIWLDMLLPASAPVSAPLAGSKMLLKFCNTVGLMCNVCLMSSRLATSTLLIDVSLSDAVPIALRFSAAKLRTSPTTALRSSAACATLLGSSANSEDTVARFWFSCSSRSALSRSAVTSVDRFFRVEKMSLLWSPSAETACESLIMASRMVGPCPRRLSAAVLIRAPSVLTPPGCVGFNNSVSR